MLLSIPKVSQQGDSSRAVPGLAPAAAGAASEPRPCPVPAELGLCPCCLSQGMAAVTGSVSRCSPGPPAAPAPAQVLLSAHSCPAQAPQSPNVTSVTPQAPLVTHQPLCPSLHVPHWPRGCPFQGISSLEHGGDNPSLPSPSQVTRGWHRGWRTLTIKFAQVGILK